MQGGRGRAGAQTLAVMRAGAGRRMDRPATAARRAARATLPRSRGARHTPIALPSAGAGTLDPRATRCAFANPGPQKCDLGPPHVRLQTRPLLLKASGAASFSYARRWRRCSRLGPRGSLKYGRRGSRRAAGAAAGGGQRLRGRQQAQAVGWGAVGAAGAALGEPSRALPAAALLASVSHAALARARQQRMPNPPPPTRCRRPDCKLHDKCFLNEGQAKSKEQYSAVQRKLITACILCFIFMIVEIIGGWIAHRWARAAQGRGGMEGGMRGSVAAAPAAPAHPRARPPPSAASRSCRTRRTCCPT